ncbi:uncharacterized protein HD556DRAFT_1249348 [Suillus plorans]|uniref:Transmembrane protein n=1 Tax=Suillus plorans TaxID=116603 RepID=A0A9P7DB62_9AGAM|nr:uncharacterized protein HD556DRAFT_1249348 [Suillus plorans]KAG1785747.1 hypothetical protein HD556DRAFT_1249348 [Suillus plorans]
MRLLVLLCVFLYLVGVIRAAPTTNTTDTTSDIFKAPSFTTRTLWSIISSSVLTLFACVYSAIHPNIPSPKHSGYPHTLWRQLGMMIMALILPELIVTWAMRQWFSAHQTHSFFVLMGGFMLYVDGKPCLTLRPDYILKLIREGCIDVPTLTAKQIHDRSKGNVISKGLVILQVAWFVIQLLTRAIYHLETTQLEMGTLAFAVLNFLTYAAWWNKPLDVQCPHPVYWKLTESMPEDHIEYVCALTVIAADHVSLSVSDRDELARFGILAPFFRPILELLGIPDIPTSRKLQVPTFDGSINLEDSDKNVLKIAALLMAIIFGVIYYMACIFTLFTGQEQFLWFMSASVIIWIPLFYVVALFRLVLLSWLSTPFYILVCSLQAILYITARTVLLVLMFTTLRDISPDAYKAVSWTSLVPHL